MTGKYELSRRKALAALGTIGVAGAGAGMGTSALFTDDEQFEDNKIVAGELDLRVTGSIPAANDEWVTADAASGFDYGEQTANGDVVTGVHLEDMKPGDWVILCYDIEVLTNPACLRLRVPKGSTANDENTITEPEADAEGEHVTPTDQKISGNGELAEALEVSVWDDLTEKVPEDSTAYGGNPEKLVDNKCHGSVSLREFCNELDKDGVSIATGTKSADFYLLLRLPREVGNEVQTDSAAWDFVFSAVQSRNNECEKPEWKKPQ